ncbi:unnamed protein product [Linum trigynum]|uniref:Uncharacterized protein n=1 Tax=Linum trigynum TaxID=586398 RepID=A0AAV2F773_9ROSI
MIAKKLVRQIYDEEEPSHAFDGAPKTVWINKVVREVSRARGVASGTVPSQREDKLDQERPKLNRRLERGQAGTAAQIPAANNKNFRRSIPRGFPVAKSPRLRAGKGNLREMQSQSNRHVRGDAGRARAAEPCNGKKNRAGMMQGETHSRVVKEGVADSWRRRLILEEDFDDDFVFKNMAGQKKKNVAVVESNVNVSPPPPPPPPMQSRPPPNVLISGEAVASDAMHTGKVAVGFRPTKEKAVKPQKRLSKSKDVDAKRVAKLKGQCVAPSPHDTKLPFAADFNNERLLLPG